MRCLHDWAALPNGDKYMGSADTLIRVPVTGVSASPAVVPDAEFEIRWAAWVARGRVHEQRVRRRFLIWAPVLGIGAAIVFALLRS
jgi:hypothetical protein